MGECLEFVDGPKVVVQTCYRQPRSQFLSSRAITIEPRAFVISRVCHYRRGDGSLPFTLPVAVRMSPSDRTSYTIGVWTKGHTNSRSNLQINVQMQSLKN
jgi:hypothetical protein